MALEVGLAATEWDLLSKTAKCASPWKSGICCRKPLSVHHLGGVAQFA